MICYTKPGTTMLAYFSSFVHANVLQIATLVISFWSFSEWIKQPAQSVKVPAVPVPALAAPESFPFFLPDLAASSLDRALSISGPPGIFTGSYTAGSYTADDDYGVYNAASMPHVRAREYIRPPKEYKLHYLEVIQRHHKRTPYASNIFFREDVEWDCTGEGPRYHVVSTGGTGIPVRWQTARNTPNPFEQTVGPGFPGSTCTFPALTSQGLLDSKKHGEDFASVYRDILGFLPEANEKEKHDWRVTNSLLTSHTLSGFVWGLYPGSTVHTAAVQPGSFDSLEPTFRCPAADRLAQQLAASTSWRSHLDRSQDLRDRFNAVAGMRADDTSGWQDSWDRQYDNLSAKQGHNLPLPCSVNQSTLCLTRQDADRIYRLDHWEFAHKFRSSRPAVWRSTLLMGPWMTEVRHHLEQAVRGESSVKYRHNFAHDGSMAALLGLLQVHKPNRPGMGAEVVFELWQKEPTEADGEAESEGGWYIRVLLSGQPLHTSTPLGRLDLIKLEDFWAYLDDMIPADPVAACSQIVQLGA